MDAVKKEIGIPGFGEKAVLKSLPFAQNALEPVMSEKTLSYHYGKHHQGYVDNYNKLIAKAEKAFYDGDHRKLTELKTGIKFNLGGHLNHEFFWDNLAPTSEEGGKLPVAGTELHKLLTKSFGSVQDFITKFSDQATGVYGSGWGWLVYDKNKNTLDIMTTGNQDRITDTSLVPLMTVDVWEHAYYLDFQNLRAKYMKEIWKVINWNKVTERLMDAKKP